MVWAIFAIVAGIFWALTNLVGKKVLSDTEPFEYTVSYVWMATILYIPFFLYFLQGTNLIFGWKAWGALGLSALGNIAGMRALYYALKEMDISVVMPIAKITPVLAAFNAWLILGEILSWMNLVGVVVVTAGGYLLLLKSDRSALEPFRRIFTDKPVFIALLSAFSFSIAAVGDRFATQIIRPEIYLFLLYIVISIAFGFIAVYKGQIRNIKRSLSRSFWMYVLAGLFAVLAISGTFQAFSMAKTGKVVSVLRIDILASVLLGGYFLHEDNILRKSIGSILIIAGVAMVVL